RGLRTCWVDRRKGRAGGAVRAVDPRAARPDLTVHSLAQLVRAFDRA
ncbi:MAG: HAD family hydrolase, partial [Planctomycetota bacterium]